MSDELLIRFGEKLWCRAGRNDVQWCAERKTLPEPNSFQGILRQLLLAGFCLLFFVGCTTPPKFQVEAITPQIFEVSVTAMTAKHDDTLLAVKQNTDTLDKIVTKIQSLEGSILDTQKQLEASLVSSKSDPGKEVIKSEDTSPDKNANDSQLASRSVAESGDVPLFVSVTSFCRPCNQIKRDWKAGKLKGFKVTWCVTVDSHKDGLIADGIPAESIIVDSWQHQDGFPSIRYPSADSPTGWAVFNPHGYGPLVLHDLRRDLLGVKAEGIQQVFPQAAQTEPAIDLVSLHNSLHGGGNWTWPGDLKSHLESFHGVDLNGVVTNRTVNQVGRQSNAVRFVSRGTPRGWRTNFVSRSSCPSGACPSR